MVSQQPLISKAFVTMGTCKRILWLGLSLNVIKELGVAGEHAATGRTGHQTLLSVTAQVLAQSILDLKEGVTAFPAAEQSLLLIRKRL